jgi:hypothetical protein
MTFPNFLFHNHSLRLVNAAPAHFSSFNPFSTFSASRDIDRTEFIKNHQRKLILATFSLSNQTNMVPVGINEEYFL